MRRKYHWNRDIDAAIVKLYQSTPKRGAVAKFAHALGYPQHLVSVRALQLGVRSTNRPDAPWSSAELAILREYHWRDLRTIQRQLSAAGHWRSVASISAARKARIDSRQDYTHLTTCTLARLCGVHVTTVRSWIELDELPCRSRRRGTTDVQSDEDMVVSIDAFRAWLVDFAHRIDLRKVDQAWFWRSLVLPTFGRTTGTTPHPAAAIGQPHHAEGVTHA